MAVLVQYSTSDPFSQLRAQLVPLTNLNRNQKSPLLGGRRLVSHCHCPLLSPFPFSFSPSPHTLTKHSTRPRPRPRTSPSYSLTLPTPTQPKPTLPHSSLHSTFTSYFHPPLTILLLYYHPLALLHLAPNPSEPTASLHLTQPSPALLLPLRLLPAPYILLPNAVLPFSPVHHISPTQYVRTASLPTLPSEFHLPRRRKARWNGLDSCLVLKSLRNPARAEVCIPFAQDRQANRSAGLSLLEAHTLVSCHCQLEDSSFSPCVVHHSLRITARVAKGRINSDRQIAFTTTENLQPRRIQGTLENQLRRLAVLLGSLPIS